MFGSGRAGHSGVVQARPLQHRRLDGSGEPGPGRPGDVEPPAAGEGQAVPGTGAHRIRGKEEGDRSSGVEMFYDLLDSHS